MTVNASALAGDNEQDPDLPFRRGYALIALRAAEHITCPAYGALRRMLIDFLLHDGHSHEDASQHADTLIEIAAGVHVSIEASEPRKTPWPGGQHAAEYAEAMFKLQEGRR